MSPEERKYKTEAILQEKGIPFLEGLPCTEEESEVQLRNVENIGKRIICLFCYAGTRFNPENENFITYLKQHNFWPYLSKEEKNFLNNPVGHNQAKINATWRMEALYFLLWSVKVISDLPWPEVESSSSDFIDVMPALDESPWPFIKNLKLRSVSEIMEASDLIYRLHWAARSYGEKVAINKSVIQEWHHAVNWLTNYDGEDWDWVATDT